MSKKMLTMDWDMLKGDFHLAREHSTPKGEWVVWTHNKKGFPEQKFYCHHQLAKLLDMAADISRADTIRDVIDKVESVESGDE